MKKTSKHEARVTAGIHGVAEVEYVYKWQNKHDNIICYGDQIAIRVCDGAYWSVNLDVENKIMAYARHIKEWEVIEIVDVNDEFAAERNRPVRYNEKVAFRFTVNKSFVGADINSESKELTARVPWVKEWETFTLIVHPQKPTSKDKKLRYGSWFALRAFNGKMVTFDRDGSKQIFARVQNLDEWEAFTFIHPSEAK